MIYLMVMIEHDLKNFSPPAAEEKVFEEERRGVTDPLRSSALPVNLKCDAGKSILTNHPSLGCMKICGPFLR